MVGRFVIRSRLGSGGMGEVYRADDTRLKRTVALKRIAPRLRADEHYRLRFLKEAEHASQLSDQHIAGIYDVLEESNETFLVMEYVEGVTLRDRLDGPFRLADFLPVAIQCTEALVAAHEKAVVHRDIKPENIMLTPRGQVKILDFGVAKRLPRSDDDTGTGSTASGSGGLTGTPAYMAPEVLLEQSSDERADIFSLGVVCYEMLAGQHPFRTESFLETTDHILHATPLPLSQVNPQVPESLSQLISGMLAKEPAGRPATAAELLPDLRALERGEKPPLRLGEFFRRRTIRAAAGVAVIAALSISIATVPTFRQWVKNRIGVVEVPQKKHLVVLPFQVVGGTPEKEAFARGIVETLTARLGGVTEQRSLMVVPASEVRAQSVSTVEQARREFGVNLVLAGSLQQSGEMLRITYALVDAATRRQLRADTITTPAGDPFAMEDRVVDSVLGDLEIALLPPEKRALAEHGTQIAAAYDDYLRGRGYLQDYHKPENIESAVKLFEQALAKDPKFALAHAGLGEAFWLRYEGTHDGQWVGQALAACEQASSLDSRLASAHTCLGVVYNGTGKYEQAAGQFRQAVELEPTSDAAYRGLAFAYQRLSQPQEAEQTYRRAISFRPEYWAGYSWLGTFYFGVGRYQDAAEMFQKVTILAPENHRGFYNLGAMQFQAGLWPEGEQSLKRSLSLRETGVAHSNLGTIYFYEQRMGEAVQAFEAAARISPKEEYIWGNLADAYRRSPDKTKNAAEAYQKAIALAESELRVNPRRADVLANLALYRAKTQAPREAAQALAEALRWAPQDPTVLYSAAVVHNLGGQPQAALAWLDKAAQRGYPLRQIQSDPEFRNLQHQPEFQRLVKALSQKGS